MLQVRPFTSVGGNVQKACPRGGGGFVQQGRSHFDARSILSVRERERREERQVCEPEGSAKWRERCWRLFSTFPFIRMESPLTAMSDGLRSFDPSFKE